jgi:enoyl-CoA hydratase
VAEETTPPLVATEERDGVWILSLARPPVNAVDPRLVAALEERAATAADSPACRAVVITGRGRAFSAGIDTKVVPAYDRAERAEMIRAVNRAILGLYGLPRPTVAAVNGHALGAGLVLALACDVRLAAAGEYRIGLAEVAAGIPFPAGPLVVVQAELTPPAARTLVLGGAAFGPTDPRAMAFLDAVCPGPSLLSAAVERARGGPAAGVRARQDAAPPARARTHAGRRRA